MNLVFIQDQRFVFSFYFSEICFWDGEIQRYNAFAVCQATPKKLFFPTE